MLAAFLFLIPFSIAACYFFFILLSLQLILYLFRPHRPLDLPPFFPYFMVFAGLTLLSTLFSINKLASIKDNRELLIYLLFPIFSLVLNSEQRIRRALAAVFVSALLSAVSGLFQVLFLGITLSDRLKGFTSHWMTFSGLLMLSFLFFSITLIFSENSKKKTYGLLLLVPLVAAIAFSLTRSVWVGTALALCAVLLIKKPRLLILAAPLGLVVFLLMPAAVQNRIISIIDPQETTNLDRRYMVHTAWRIWIDHPLTGVGADNIPEVYERYLHPQADKTNVHLHNNLLQILAERGVFTMLALLIALIAVGFYLCRIARRGPPQRRITAWGSLAVFIGFFVAGLFEYNFGDSEIQFLLFFFLALPFLPLEEGHDKAKQS